MTASYDVVLATITRQLEKSLTDSRARPIPAAPSALADEPQHSDQLFQTMLEATPGGRASALDPATPDPSFVVPDDFDPVGASVTELLAAFAAGVTTPTEVLAALSPFWMGDEAWADAVLALVPGAEAAAAESDFRWATGDPRPLEGIPVAVKDIIDVEGAAVTSGSWQTGDRIASADATVVERLKAAGAIPVFISATTEFACGGPHNARYGAVRNPWDEERWTGGSSTGSGGGLASRIVPLALGSDTGGSIRGPAALCGITGIKPTYGLVPRTGVASLAWTLDHIGPMARSAAELAVVLPHLAGPDGYDPSAGHSVPDLTSDPSLIRGMRIGTPRTWFTERVDGDVLAAYEAALTTFVELGATLVDVEFDGLEEADGECWHVFYGELASNQEANAATVDLFDEGTRARFEVSFTPSAADYLRALRRRPIFQRQMLARMDEAGIDVFVTPGLGATAPLLADLTMVVDGTRYNLHDVIPRNTRIFDYTGFPALMMPSGFAGDGLPVGIQVIARPWHDRLCLSTAMAFQGATDFHLRVPPGSVTNVTAAGVAASDTAVTSRGGHH